MSDASNESQSSPMGPREFEVPRRVELVRFGGAAGNAVSTDLFFRMITPDARLLQKLTLVAVAVGTAPGRLVVAGRGLTLWLYEVELDQVRGKQFIPCVDLASSTSAAPLNMPANATLGGFSREFVTSGDAIEGRLRVPAQAPGGVAGSVYLQARFQPAAFRLMPWEEWDEVRGQCKVDRLGDVLVVP